MKVLQKYLARNILGHIGLVSLVLIAIQIFILFVSELSAIGSGNYTVWQAMLYVAMKLPYQMYLFFPVACVLGCLVGLGSLASSSELIVMRASGASIAKISWTVIKAALLLIILVSVLGETVIPALVHKANNRRASLTSGGEATRSEQGTWLKQGNRFIHIRAVYADSRVTGISEFVFDSDHQLKHVIYAPAAKYQDHQWLLINPQLSDIGSSQITAHHLKYHHWSIQLDPKILHVMTIEPEEMNLHELWQFMHAQAQSGIANASFSLNFWQRLFRPLASCVMIFLAIPFVFGPMRQVTMGSRIVLGAVFGFGFHLLNEFFGPLSLLYQFPPLLAAILPTVLFGLLAVFMLRRIR